MPVTLQKSTFTDPNDLLDKIRAFLLTNGWTVNNHAVDGTGFRLHVSKGTLYFNLRSYKDEHPFTTGTGSTWTTSLGDGIALNGSDGYDGGQAWDTQPGAPVNLDGVYQGHYMPQVPTGTATYWFILGTNPDAFYCIAEVSADQYRYLALGELDKFYTWTGGAFTAASYSRMDRIESLSLQYVPLGMNQSADDCGGFVRATYDSFDGWLGRYYQPTTLGTNMSTGNGFLSSVHEDASMAIAEQPSEPAQILRVPGYGRSDHAAGTSKAYAGLWDRMYNTANNVSILLPNFVYGRRLDLGFVYSLLGRMPHAYLVNMIHLTPDTVYAYGANNYHLIPTYSMNTLTGVQLSRPGLAFQV